MNATHTEVIPGVGYTVHCKRGSSPLTVQSYDATGAPSLTYTVQAGRSAYIVPQYRLLLMESAGKCAWSITPLSILNEEGGVETLKGPKGDPGPPGPPGPAAEVDAAYDPSSPRAQAGTAVAEALMTPEAIISETPAGNDNATCNYVELAAMRSFEGTLSALSYRTGSSTVSGMTTAPLWLAVWEQEAAESTVYHLVGVSRNSITQAINSTLTWEFDALPLHGRRLRLIPTTDPALTAASTAVNLRIRTSTATDGTKCFMNGSGHNFCPKMTLTGLRHVARYAEAADLSAHVANAGQHLAEAQHNVLACLDWDSSEGLSIVSRSEDGTVTGRLKLGVGEGFARLLCSDPVTLQAAQSFTVSRLGACTFHNKYTGATFNFCGWGVYADELAPYGFSEACTWYGDPVLPLLLRGSELRINGSTIDVDTLLQLLSHADALLALLPEADPEPDTENTTES